VDGGYFSRRGASHSSALGWLIQWAMGLCAVASIASERQRGTWDGLLVSPPEGREIVWAKICGGVYALRGFVAAVVLA
jgi:ABC-type Na+ efflux pump permease subunit